MIKAKGNRTSIKGDRFDLLQEFCGIVYAVYNIDALCPGDTQEEKKASLLKLIDIALDDDEDDDLPETGDGVASLSDIIAKAVCEWMESEDEEPRRGKE